MEGLRCGTSMEGPNFEASMEGQRCESFVGGPRLNESERPRLKISVE